MHSFWAILSILMSLGWLRGRQSGSDYLSYNIGHFCNPWRLRILYSSPFLSTREWQREGELGWDRMQSEHLDSALSPEILYSVLFHINSLAAGSALFMWGNPLVLDPHVTWERPFTPLKESALVFSSLVPLVSPTHLYLLHYKENNDLPIQFPSIHV